MIFQTKISYAPVYLTGSEAGKLIDMLDQSTGDKMFGVMHSKFFEWQQ